MTEERLHALLCFVEIALAVPVFLLLLFVTAPYGRHTRRGWGPTIRSRLGWALMESPSSVGFALVFFAGERRFHLVPLVFFALWQAHYVHRTFIFPFRLRSTPKQMPAAVALMALVFNGLNAWINARWVSDLGRYDAAWLLDPRFVAGVALFVVGYAVNQQSDAILLSLRAPGETGYKVPRGGLYRWVSCPNYLGELLEWAGWALATWSLAGAAFAVFTAANLVPRALSNHRWLRGTFADYPPERRALVPWLL